MPREIQAVQFWQKIIQNLRAVNTRGFQPQLFESLVIVGDVFEMGALSFWAGVNLSLTSAQDTHVPALTCGKNNRIKIRSLSVAATTGTHYTFTFAKASGNTTQLIAARDTGRDYVGINGELGVILEEGDSVGSGATGNALDSSILFVVFYDILSY